MMNLSINGESQVPPGFRFHPTEEELLHYYLRKKMTSQKIDLDVISEVDLNKLEPWDIQEKCKIGCTPQNDWYFFSHKDKKYPTGTRTNRATAAGFWKATGRDKFIYSGLRRIGLRKTLVFYKGRAPHGLKSDWIMHEYRLDEGSNDPKTIVSNSTGESCGEDDGWVVCRVFKKKNYLKTVETPNSTPNASSNFYVDSDLHHHQLLGSRNDGVLDQMLMYMGSSSSTCKLENINESVMTFSDRFMRLPRLDSPTPTSTTDLNNTGITNSSFNQDPVGLFKTNYYEQTTSFDDILNIPSSNGQLHEDDTVLLLENDHNHSQNSSRVNDWFALDRLVASQLIGSNTTDQEENDKSKQLSFFGDPNNMTSFCSSPHHQDDNDTQLSYQYIRTSSEGRSHSNQTSTHHDEVYGTSDNDRLWDFN